jgi:endonuclease/exonuclease/phosphatase family metal-dependent hydrolase
MNAVYDHGHHGNALLSAFPIANSQPRCVRPRVRAARHPALRAGHGARPVHCYVVHFGLFEAGRRRQTQALIAAVRESAPDGEPVIIAGDFNDWRNTSVPNCATRSACAKRSMKSAAIPRSMSWCVRCAASRACIRPAPFRRLAVFRLDRIYVRGFQVETAQVLHGSLWAKLSDHAPIVANLTLT